MHDSSVDGEECSDSRSWDVCARDVIMRGFRDNSQIGRTFDPGAAHMSKTIWCGSTSRKSGGSIETASWRVMFPYEKESRLGL